MLHIHIQLHHPAMKVHVNHNKRQLPAQKLRHKGTGSTMTSLIIYGHVYIRSGMDFKGVSLMPKCYESLFFQK